MRKVVNFALLLLHLESTVLKDCLSDLKLVLKCFKKLMKNEQEHDILMKKFLDRVREYNVKFNSDKLQYKVHEVKYVGQVISSNGIKAD